MKKEFNIKLNLRNLLLTSLVVYSLLTTYMWYDEWDAREYFMDWKKELREESGELRMENTELRQKLRDCR